MRQRLHFSQYGSSAYRSPTAPRRSERSCCLIGALVIGSIVALASIAAVVLLIMNPNQVSTSIANVAGSAETAIPTSTPLRVDVATAQAVGDTATLADLRLTMTDVTNPAEIPDLRPPLPNHQFWAVDIELENTAAEGFVRVSADNAHLQDAAGNVYGGYLQVLMQENEPPLAATLQPGTNVSDTLTYEVPLGIDELFWVYHDAASGEYAVFTIR